MAGIGNLGVFGDFGGEDEKLRKKSQLEGTSGELFASNEPLTVNIGSGVWSVGLTMMGKKRDNGALIVNWGRSFRIRDF